MYIIRENVFRIFIVHLSCAGNNTTHPWRQQKKKRKSWHSDTSVLMQQVTHVYAYGFYLFMFV